MPVFTLNLVIQDEKGLKSTVSINFDGTNDEIALADLEWATGQVAPIVEDLITGAIVGVGWTYTPAFPSGLRAAPLADSDVEEGGKFIFTSTPPYITSVRIPTLDETLVVNPTKDINLANAAVIAFVNLMEDGLTHVALPMPVTDYRGEDVTVLKSAREQFGKDRGMPR